MPSSAQEKFNIACTNYKRVVDIFNEMTEKVKEIEPEFEAKFAVLQYDWILQAVLLATAIADGKFMSLEQRFIEQITDNGDILTALNQKIAQEGLDFQEITWENLAELITDADDERREKLVMFIMSLAYANTDLLINYFAPVDAISQKDYLELIEDATMHIILAFCEIDGDSLEQYDEDDGVDTPIEAEVSTAYKMLDTMLVGRWSKCIEDFEKFRRDGGKPDNN